MKSRHTVEQLAIFVILAVMVAAGFYLIISQLPTIGPEALVAILPVYGLVVSKFGDAVSYFVGTTLGSAKKNDGQDGTKLP